jgi:excinuclease UvrABC nuclease subunit
MPTRQWSDMDKAIRHRVDELAADGIPISAGVYAWYRSGERQYVGTAASLRDRLWKNHLGQSRALTSSALRRNVAEMLHFGAASALKRREIELTSEQLAAVRDWIVSCELAWLTCDSAADARELEAQLLEELRPRLNKREPR